MRKRRVKRGKLGLKKDKKKLLTMVIKKKRDRTGSRGKEKR